MPCFSPNFAVSSRSLWELSYLSSLAGRSWRWAPACSCSPNLSQDQHQNWHQHGETWDSLVAALRETKISIRAGIRGHYGNVTFWTGWPSIHPTLEPSTAVRLDSQTAARLQPDRPPMSPDHARLRPACPLVEPESRLRSGIEDLLGGPRD